MKNFVAQVKKKKGRRDICNKEGRSDKSQHNNPTPHQCFYSIPHTSHFRFSFCCQDQTGRCKNIQSEHEKEIGKIHVGIDK